MRIPDYGARMYDPEIARWTTVDPMGEEYYPYSPYNYTLGNPVRFTDKFGMWVVGTDGKKVTYSQESGWSKNASADVQRVGNAMMKISTGAERLSMMLNHDEKISISIDSNVSREGNRKQYGLDSKKVSQSSDGSFVAEHNITIFEGSIIEAIEGKGGHFPGMDFEDAIGATAGHESGHVDKENTKQRMYNELKGTNYDTEAEPRKIERQMIKEYRELKKKNEDENY